MRRRSNVRLEGGRRGRSALNILLDASVAAAWFVPGQDTQSSAQLLTEAPRHTFAAPQFFYIEIRNVFLSAERRGRMREADTLRSLSVLASFNLATAPSPSLREYDDVLTLARQEGLTIYDGIYLWHAAQSRMTLATRHADLIDASHRVGSSVLDLR